MIKRLFCLGSGKGKKPDLLLKFRFPLQPQGEILGRGRNAEGEKMRPNSLLSVREKLWVPWASSEFLENDHIQKLLLNAYLYMTPVTNLVKRKLPSTFRIYSFFMNRLDHGDRHFIPILKMALKGLDEFTLKGGLSQR